MAKTRRATNQAKAGPSMPRQPSKAIDQPEDEPQMPSSPLPSRDDAVPFEELQSKVIKYTHIINKHAEPKKGKGKRKRKRKARNGIQARRKKVAFIHDKILTHMLEIEDRCHARGFIYGMVPEIGKLLSGASDSLRGYWKEQVMFDKKGPAQIEIFYTENSLLSHVPPKNEPRSTFEMLMLLSDPNLGSFLSVLMQQCSPKQRQFPLEKGVPPPWWPTATEIWWDQTGIPRAEGRPPYRKPHDLNKKWKAGVLLGIIKHMSPNFHKFYNLPQQYRYLMDRMSAKELKYWNLALREEAKGFCAPDEPLESKFPFLMEQGVNDPRQNAVALGGAATEQGAIAHGQTEMTQTQPPIFTCDNPRCCYNDPRFGFPTPEQRDRHRFSCAFANQALQFGAPTGDVHEPPSFTPSNSHYSTWQATMPLIGQSQPGMQMSSYFSQNSPMATSEMFAPSFAPSTVQQFAWPNGQSQHDLQMNTRFPRTPLATLGMFTPTTMPFMDQSQQGVQMSGSYFQSQVAPFGEMFAQPTPNVSSEVQGSDPVINRNYNVGDFGASGSAFHQSFLELQVGDSTGGTQEMQHQLHGHNVDGTNGGYWDPSWFY